MSYLMFVLLFIGLTGLQKRVNGGQLLDQLAFLHLYLLQLRTEGLHLSRALPHLSLQSPNMHLAFCKGDEEDTEYSSSSFNHFAPEVTSSLPHRRARCRRAESCPEPSAS